MYKPSLTEAERQALSSKVKSFLSVVDKIQTMKSVVRRLEADIVAGLLPGTYVVDGTLVIVDSEGVSIGDKVVSL